MLILTILAFTVEGRVKWSTSQSGVAVGLNVWWEAAIMRSRYNLLHVNVKAHVSLVREVALAA